MWQKRTDLSAVIYVTHDRSIFDEQSTVLFIMSDESELQNVYLKDPSSSLL